MNDTQKTRGRQKGHKSPMIKDECISPYVITYNENNFSVYEDEEGMSPVGHFSSLENALFKICLLKAVIPNKEFTVLEYINIIKETKNNILKSFSL